MSTVPLGSQPLKAAPASAQQRSGATAHARRFIILDLLRAVAVLTVIVYHAFPAALPSGYLGVDLFFVLSGFLITRGLLARTIAGRMGDDDAARLPVGRFVKDFYVKRARRLFPAFFFMLVTVCSLALLAPQDVRVHLGRQVLGALTSTANWVQLLTGSSYFDAGTPKLLKHMWSLSVEEQFYLVWPAVILAVAALVRRRPRPASALRTRLASFCLAGAVLSAAAMAAVFAATGDLNQGYLNTFTHASGLLLGAYVACMPILTRASGAARAAALVLSSAVVLLCFATLQDDSPASQLGGIFVFSLAVALLVRLGTTGSLASLDGTSAGWLPVRWVADRSYALYLWHWPLLVLAAAWIPDPNGGRAELPLLLARAALALVPAFLLSEISYRLFEKPVLTRGFRGAWAAAAPAWKKPALAGLGAVLAAAMVFAAVTAPVKTVQQEQLEALQAKTKALNEQPQAAPTPSSSPGSTSSPSPSATTTPAKEDPVTAQGIDSSQVTFVGDSVTVAASDTIRSEYSQSRILATVGQQMWTAQDEIAKARNAGTLGRIVVVALGTNGTFSEENLRQVFEAGGGERRFVFVTGYGPQDWIPDANAKIRAFAASHPDRVRVAEWAQGASKAKDMAADGVHPGPQGAKIWIDLVTKAIKSFGR